MKEANKFFDEFKSKLVGGLYTGCIGQIENYDPIANKADVVLLPDDELITDVPVSIPQTADYFIRIPYEPGDYVFVAFSMRDIDGIMHEGDAAPSRRMLDKNDAIVIGGINLFSDPLPSDNLDKLVIGQKDGSTKIVVGDDINFLGKILYNGVLLENGQVGPQGPKGDKGDKGDTGAQGIQGIQGPKGDQGPIGLTGPAGPKGDKGDTGPQGPIGLTGPQGVKGDTGPQGPQGIKGDKGDKGDTGATGPQGLQGIQGPKGDTGPQGLKGDTGATGAQGPKGDKGDTGAQGPQGPQGNPGATWINGTGTPASGIGVNNDYFLNTLNGDVYQKTNGSWAVIANIKGPQGAQGIQGPKGDTGATGATGPQGLQGIQGPKGDTGATGPTGAQGPKGDKGDQGLQGIQGPVGPQGPKGDKGDQGIQGPQGIQGDPGATWLSGSAAPGAVGVNNDYYLNTTNGDVYKKVSGAWVVVGNIRGPQGIQGIQGVQGIQGPKGDTGATGPQGIKGDTGAQGPQGIQGPQGPKGDQGTGLQYQWNGTMLGVKRDNDFVFVYQDLQGPPGASVADSVEWENVQNRPYFPQFFNQDTEPQNTRLNPIYPGAWWFDQLTDRYKYFDGGTWIDPIGFA